MAPDVVLIADGGGLAAVALAPMYGAERVAELLARGNRLAATFETTASWFALIENTSVTVVLAGAGRRLLVTLNDCTHLYDPVVQRPAP